MLAGVLSGPYRPVGDASADARADTSAEAPPMIGVARLIRLVAGVAGAIVVLSFALFAIERGAADTSSEERRLQTYQQPSPTRSEEAKRERVHGSPREAIDDGNDFLLAPFADFTTSRDIWVQRLVPAAAALIALLIVAAALSSLFIGIGRSNRRVTDRRRSGRQA